MNYREMVRVVDGSLPAWGVWIEIFLTDLGVMAITSLPAWGVWIEIIRDTLTAPAVKCRSPHGECGLKFLFFLSNM